MSKSFLKGAAFGAFIASVATLFLAPQSGKKTQKEVKKLVDKLSNQLLAQSKNLKKMSKGNYEEMVGNALKEFSKGSKISKQYLEEVGSALKDRWDDFREELELAEEIVADETESTKKTATKLKKATKKAAIKSKPSAKKKTRSAS